MMEVKLVVASGSHQGQVIEVKREIFEIGKSPRCQLNPGGPGIGRHHCAIFRKEGFAAVKPLDPVEKTILNGTAITKPMKLRNGDKLQVGSMTFEIQLTVGVSGQKLSKVQSVTEAAARIVEKKQIEKKKSKAAGATDDDSDLDIFAIFGEEAPDEEDQLVSIMKRNRDQAAEASEEKKDVEEDAMAREKRLQESTRNAAGDAIKAMLSQTRKGG
ncbi:MAG: FHA domain-containing protein [Thermoguttaceae bacterium]|nr:FHA domain-containing protein [Thermoguttaceae bacterium]MBR0192539.1 FHA domain-containing protein [Thermoguttaceae bacterium]